jgi:hypothetical protein
LITSLRPGISADRARVKGLCAARGLESKLSGRWGSRDESTGAERFPIAHRFMGAFQSFMGALQILWFDHDGLKIARSLGRHHGRRQLLELIGLPRDQRGIEPADAH